MFRPSFLVCFCFFSMSSFRIRRNNMSYYTFCSPLLPCPFLYPPFVPPALFWLRSLFLVTGEVQIIIAESIPSLVPLYSVGRNSNIFYGKIAYLITMRHSITQNQDRNLSSVSEHVTHHSITFFLTMNSFLLQIYREVWSERWLVLKFEDLFIFY